MHQVVFIIVTLGVGYQDLKGQIWVNPVDQEGNIILGEGGFTDAN